MINNRIIDQLKQPILTLRKEGGIIFRHNQAGALSGAVLAHKHSGDDRVS